MAQIDPSLSAQSAALASKVTTEGGTSSSPVQAGQRYLYNPPVRKRATVEIPVPVIEQWIKLLEDSRRRQRQDADCGSFFGTGNGANSAARHLIASMQTHLDAALSNGPVF